jgi:hypothetical protein
LKLVSYLVEGLFLQSCFHPSTRLSHYNSSFSKLAITAGGGGGSQASFVYRRSGGGAPTSFQPPSAQAPTTPQVDKVASSSSSSSSSSSQQAQRQQQQHHHHELPSLYVVPPLILDNKGVISNNGNETTSSAGFLSSISSAVFSSLWTNSTSGYTAVFWVHGEGIAALKDKRDREGEYMESNNHHNGGGGGGGGGSNVLGGNAINFGIYGSGAGGSMGGGRASGYGMHRQSRDYNKRSGHRNRSQGGGIKEYFKDNLTHMQWLRTWSNAIFVIVVDLCEPIRAQENSVIKHLKKIQASGCDNAESIILVGTKSDVISGTYDNVDVNGVLESVARIVTARMEHEFKHRRAANNLLRGIVFGPPPPITSFVAVDATNPNGTHTYIYVCEIIRKKKKEFETLR